MIFCEALLIRLFEFSNSLLFLLPFLPACSRNFCSSSLVLLKPKIRPFLRKKKAGLLKLFFFSLSVVLFSLPKKKNNLKISITKVASLHHSFLENGSVLLDAV